MGSKHRERSFKFHQKLAITHVSFQRKAIAGFVELSIQPSTSKLQSIGLNFHSTRITRARISIDDREADAVCEFGTTLDCVVPLQSQKRNFEYFSSALKQGLGTVDPELGGRGELIIHIPHEFLPAIQERSPFKVRLDFDVDSDSSSGIHFVVPKGEGSFASRAAHMFTSCYGNSARLCFPCVDSVFELCTWTLQFTVDESMVVVSSGDLIETVLSESDKKKTYYYEMTIPTAAPHIGWAIGPFEIYPNPAFSEITHFCLPGLTGLLKDTIQFFKEAFGHIEDLLSTKFPYSSYKQVFIDQSYAEVQSYATLTLLSTYLLHSSRYIDQAIATRRVLAHTLTQQYFTCYIGWKSWNDWWLVSGISGYLYGLYIQKAFGTNEYRYWLKDEMDTLCRVEREHGLPPLHVSALASSNSLSRTPNPNTTLLRNFAALSIKAHLVMRLLEVQIGRDFLLQVFNKLLSLASAAAVQPFTANTWGRLLLSTQGFIKILSTVSGKDMQVFLEQWVFRSGCARLCGKFVFNRKRNIVELELKQDMPTGSKKFVGPLTVCIQELDGSFKHVIQVEETVSKHDITCHSKSRRNKKKKIPLQTGDEIDMDLSRTDTDSPVLWVRIDPEMHWLRQVEMEQPDFMWQLQMKYERDVVSQLDAVAALGRYPSEGAKAYLQDVIRDGRCYHRVRMEAVECLAKCLGEFPSGSYILMTKLHNSLFGSHSFPTIVRLNDFSDFSAYFVQKAFPLALAKVRDAQKQTPQGVVDFLCQLILYNENRVNKFSDSSYLSSLIKALSLTVNPALAVQGARQTISSAAIASEVLRVQTVISEVVHYLNLDKLLPSYKQEITVSCLHALRRLQKYGHLPSDASIFRQYAREGLCDDVRMAAFYSLVDFAKDAKDESELLWLLNFIRSTSEAGLKYRVLQALIDHPPFARKGENSKNTPAVVEKLWSIMTIGSEGDLRLRIAAMELYTVLYGKITPSCLPQGLGVVIDLSRQAITRKPSIELSKKTAEPPAKVPSIPKPSPSLPPPPPSSSQLKIPKKEPVVAGLDIPASTLPKTKSHKHKHKKRKHAEAFGSEESKKKAIEASSSVVSQTLPPLENFPAGGGVDLSSPFPSKAIDSSSVEKKKHKKAKHKEHKEHKHKKHKHHKKSDPDPV